MSVPFSIVVVTWNSSGELPELLKSARQHLAAEHEFVFVDNGSSDRTLELLEQRRSEQVRLVCVKQNIGFGAAANLGTTAARYEVVVLLNPDCVLIDSSLEALAELASENRALCGPRMLNGDGSWQSSAFARFGSWETILLAIWPAGNMPRYLVRRCDPWRLHSRLEVGWISAGCLAAPRELLLKLGPFDERLLHYGEDTDLCLRARRARIRVIFAPDAARVIHHGGASAVRAFPDRGARRQMDARIWIARHRFGHLRASFVIFGLLLEHLTRLVAKSLMGRDPRWDRACVRAWSDVVLRGHGSDPQELPV